MGNPRLSFETASQDDVSLMIEWAAREGWNPGLQDAGCFFGADGNGFRVARQDGQVVACLSLVSYGPNFAFLGLYIARPEIRGQGVGHALWHHALDACTARTIGLDGVVDQQQNYRKSGFVLACRNIRYGGSPPLRMTPADPFASVTPPDLDAIIAYDRRFFGAARARFLSFWVSAPGHRALFAAESGAVTGYGVIRPCREGHKIGPLFADNREIAERLFDTLAHHARGGPVFMDLPEPNAAATEICRLRGLEPVFETARMYRGEPPVLPLENVFGISSLELG